MSEFCDSARVELCAELNWPACTELAVESRINKTVQKLKNFADFV